MKIILKLLSIILVYSSFVSAQEHCPTPDSKEGRCVPVKQCTAVWNAIINRDHITNPDVASYLRNAQCGLHKNSQKVCCALEYVDSVGAPEETENVHKTTKDTTRMSHYSDNSVKLLMHKNSMHLNFKTCGYTASGNVSEYKWIVNLWYSLKTDDQTLVASKCLGVLISKRTLVAPAHCIASLPTNIMLINVKVNGQEIGIDKIDIHPNYNNPKFSNDIALLRLQFDVDDKLALPVCLPKYSDIEKRVSATLKKENGVYPADVDFLENNECETTYNLKNIFKIQPGQSCVVVKDEDFKSNDVLIGATVERLTSKNQYELMGFSSSAIKSTNDLSNQAYIFTDIVHYLDWIMDSLDEKREKKVCSIPDTRVEGYCVLMQHCTIIREAPKPLPNQIQYIVNNSKCLTSDDLNGICCLSKYIDEAFELEQEETRALDFRPLEHKSIKFFDLESCGTVDSGTRIVGGEEAELNQFPWIALIKYHIDGEEKFECGGSLISNRYVLTAAHCLTKLPMGYKAIAVRFGEHDLRTDEDCVIIGEVNGVEEKVCAPPVQDIPIQHSLAHPRYDIPRFANDIGLVKLSRAPDMSLKNIAPICLPVTDELRKYQSPKFKVAGFGVSESGFRSDILLHITVPFVELNQCQQKHGRSIKLSDGHFCAGGVGIMDSCKGDSGGPSFFVSDLNGKEKYVQYGVVAAGHAQCGSVKGFPGIYSNTSYYLQWILDNMTE